jgi:hypothetical protein
MIGSAQVVTAWDWYLWFLRAYATDKGIAGVHKKAAGSSEFTDAVKGALKKLGQERGFDIPPRERLRVDMIWMRKGTREGVVAIEHENEGWKTDKVVKSEVANLLTLSTPLMVLITYFHSSFFNRELNLLSHSILKELQNRARFSSEFLLVAGMRDYADRPQLQPWAAYRYSPSVKMEPILHLPFEYW